MIKANITRNRTYQHHLPSNIIYLEAHTIISVVLLPKMPSKYEKISDKIQIEDSLQDSLWNAKTEKLTETREMWQLNSVWDSGLDPEAEKKDVSEKTGKILMRSVD